MRLLDVAGIEYEGYEYDKTLTDGVSIARVLNRDENEVFKTLVTVGADNEHYIFVVPVAATLDLKKAARAVGVKAIEMIKQKELLPLTGYIHGGCSPISMKKPFRTVIDETAILFDKICVSAGRVGYQIRLNPDALASYVGAKFVDIVKD
jgi:Cys-tRNA(Pro)/Cys-tRNA(Cys) deacylase